jgi:hypothetical protein
VQSRHRIPGVALELAGHQVAHNNAPRLPIYHHQVQHFPPGIDLNAARLHHPHHGAVGSQQKLLAGLPPGVEGTRHLGSTERSGCPADRHIPGKGHPLGHTLVDDAAADFRQPMHVGFAGPVVAPFDGVVEQPPDAVAIVGIVFGGVDAPLGGNAVGTAGGVLNTKAFDPVAQFCQGGGGRGPG